MNTVLGRDVILTLRVPNPGIEQDMRKSMVEALQSVPSARDMASSFYGDLEEEDAPIQEVILPFTTSAEELSLVEAYYRKMIVGQETETLVHGRQVKDWVGEFFPKQLRVIPLIEDMEHLHYCDTIVEEYMHGRDLPYQRVFLARSDPALNYGIVAAELVLKMGLHRLYDLERRLGVPLYPIIGAGSVPFRGHLTPTNIDRALREYPSAHTFTVQSAFKYDYDKDTVRNGIAQILAHERGEPVPIDQERARELVDRDYRRVPVPRPPSDRGYQFGICQHSQAAGAQAPRRPVRLRPLLGGVGDDVTLPRAIGFAASMYSIGVPPELLDLAALSPEDLSFVREVYPSLDEDLRAAFAVHQRASCKGVAGRPPPEHSGPVYRRDRRVHEGLTSAIWAGISSSNTTVNIPHYVEEAAHLRRFLG